MKNKPNNPGVKKEISASLKKKKPAIKCFEKRSWWRNANYKKQSLIIRANERKANMRRAWHVVEKTCVFVCFYVYIITACESEAVEDQ